VTSSAVRVRQRATRAQPRASQPNRRLTKAARLPGGRDGARQAG
jgi:hypothetical protein